MQFCLPLLGFAPVTLLYIVVYYGGGFIYTVNESLVILGEVIDEREIEKA